MVTWIQRVRNAAATGVVAAAAAVGVQITTASGQDAFAVGGVPADITSFAPGFAAAAGTYARYNIKPDIITIEGGSRGVQVLLSGKIQAMQVGFSVVINANQQGADLRMISASANYMPFEIFVSPNIKSPADLKGQKIAISAFASETDMAVTLATKKWGMTRDDVIVTPLGGGSQRLAAHLSGQVAAGVYISPQTATARERGLVPMLDLGSAGTPYLFNGVVVNKDYLDSHRDVAMRFVKAIVDGVYKALADEAWAKGVIAKEFKTDNKAIIDDAYASLKKTFPLDYAPSREAARNVIDEVKATGAAVSSANLDDYLDTGIVDALKKENFYEDARKRAGL